MPSDKYFQNSDNMPEEPKQHDAKGEKLLSDPGKASSKYSNDHCNSCDDAPKSGESMKILEGSGKDRK